MPPEKGDDSPHLFHLIYVGTFHTCAKTESEGATGVWGRGGQRKGLREACFVSVYRFSLSMKSMSLTKNQGEGQKSPSASSRKRNESGAYFESPGERFHPPAVGPQVRVADSRGRAKIDALRARVDRELHVIDEPEHRRRELGVDVVPFHLHNPRARRFGQNVQDRRSDRLDLALESEGRHAFRRVGRLGRHAVRPVGARSEPSSGHRSPP